MIITIIILIMLITMALALIMLNFLISKKSFSDREKSSPFECGFDPITNLHSPFSMHFFIISLVFLIFDIEIIFIIPLIFNLILFNLTMLIFSISLMFILLLGLYIEYIDQALDWKI